MNRLEGSCFCGKLRIEVELTEPPGAYAPRACDCAFCRKHGAAYVSDAAGALRIRYADPQALIRYRQGSGQAEFLMCRECGVLVAVCLEDSGQRFGAVNAQALADAASFAPALSVSPRELDPDAKRARWKNLWFPGVSLEKA
ncbi:MAG: aldehyde-activating protein [Burkholderiales bacterium]|nr:MAG: aldehyde-activating protein [Burkholderiales bacterium]